MIEKEFDQQANGIINHIKLELQGIRGGRATPSLVENITVEAYGAKSPLVQLASINAPDSKTLVIEPWDKSIMKNIEAALSQSDLGISPTNEGKIIRLTMPLMTEENRQKFVRLVEGHLEESKIAVRNVREEIIKNIKRQEKNKELSEDQAFAEQKKLQEKVDQINQQIEEIGEKKRVEIMSI